MGPLQKRLYRIREVTVSRAKVTYFVEKGNTVTEIHRAKLARKGRTRDQRHRLFIHAQKDRPCLDCGVKYAPWVMDFDHRNPEEKLFNISAKAHYSISKLTREMTKCDLVCANCHRDRTYRQRYATLSERQ